MSDRSRTKLSYPLPDSFPSIYGEAEDGGVLALPVTTSLSTTSATNGDLRLLRDAISPAVAVEERETLRSSLADMADEYQNRWSSDSDSGSDD